MLRAGEARAWACLSAHGHVHACVCVGGWTQHDKQHGAAHLGRLMVARARLAREARRCGVGGKEEADHTGSREVMMAAMSVAATSRLPSITGLLDSASVTTPAPRVVGMPTAAHAAPNSSAVATGLVPPDVAARTAAAAAFTAVVLLERLLVGGAGGSFISTGDNPILDWCAQVGRGGMGARARGEMR